MKGEVTFYDDDGIRVLFQMEIGAIVRLTDTKTGKVIRMMRITDEDGKEVTP